LLEKWVLKKIIYIQYTNPSAYPPLIHSSNILLDAGWLILFLGVHQKGKSDNIVMPEKQGRESRMLKWVVPGIRQKLHFLRFLLWTVFVSMRERADLIYCSDPFSTLSGVLLKKMGFRVIYHEHDSPNSGEEDKLQSLIVWARRKLLREASLVFFPNELRLKRAQNWSGSVAPAKVVWNCPSIAELGIVDEVHYGEADENQPLRLYYHGTLVPDRLPLTILDGISISNSKVELTLVGYTTIGSNSYDEIMKEHASELGIGDCLHFKGALPTRNDVMIECRKHDAGLVLFTGEGWEIYATEMAGASNKPFDYLSQGIAVLVPDLPVWKELYVNNNCAIEANPDDAELLAELFDWLAHHRKEVQEMGRKGRELIEREWNYEKQFQPVLEWIESDKPVVEKG